MLAACSSGGSSSDAAGSDSSGKAYKIGVVLFSAADTSSMSMVTPFTTKVKSAGSSVEQIDSKGDGGQAIAAIQNFVTKKVDAIFIPVFQPSQLAAGLAAAKAAKIPVIGMGGGTGDGMPVSWDNATAAGRITAERIVSDTGGKGQLLAITYSPGKPCQIRLAQLKSALASTTIKVDQQELQVADINGSVERETTAWLAKHPKGSDSHLSIWLCADSEVPGTISGTRSANRTDVEVYSMGGEGPALTALQQKRLTMDVYVDMAGAGDALAAKIPAIIKAGVDAPPSQVAVKGKALDSTNIAEFVAANPTLVSGS